MQRGLLHRRLCVVSLSPLSFATRTAPRSADHAHQQRFCPSLPLLHPRDHHSLVRGRHRRHLFHHIPDASLTPIGAPTHTHAHCSHLSQTPLVSLSFPARATISSGTVTLRCRRPSSTSWLPSRLCSTSTSEPLLQRPPNLSPGVHTLRPTLSKLTPLLLRFPRTQHVPILLSNAKVYIASSRVRQCGPAHSSQKALTRA